MLKFIENYLLSLFEASYAYSNKNINPQAQASNRSNQSDKSLKTLKTIISGKTSNSKSNSKSNEIQKGSYHEN